MLIDIPNFAGAIKKLDETMLPPQNASLALDCRLDNGALRPWRDPSAVLGLEETPNGYISWHPNRYVGWSDYDETDGFSTVNAVNAPVANDEFKRLYYTGDVRDEDGANGAIDGDHDRPKTTYSNSLKEPGDWLRLTIDDVTQQAKPPEGYYWMGVPAWRDTDKPLDGAYAIAGKGQIDYVDVQYGNSALTRVYVTKPITTKALKTGDYVFLNYPGLAETPYRVKVPNTEADVPLWNNATTYALGALVKFGIGFTQQMYRSIWPTANTPVNLNQVPTASPEYWRVVTEVSSNYFDLMDYQPERKNWTQLTIKSTKTSGTSEDSSDELIITCSGHGVNDGDSIVVRATMGDYYQQKNDGSWERKTLAGGWIDNTRVGYVSRVIDNNRFAVTGLLKATLANNANTVKIWSPDVNAEKDSKFVAFLILSRQGNSFGKVATIDDAESWFRLDEIGTGVADWNGAHGWPVVIATKPREDQNTWSKTSVKETEVEVSYLVTCVNFFGEEGGPSLPSDSFFVIPGEGVPFDFVNDEPPFPYPPDYEPNDPTHIAGWENGHGLRTWRLYRTDQSGTYRYVDDILFPETKADADARDWVSGDDYPAGTFVNHNGKYYRALQNQYGTDSYEPGQPNNQAWWYEVKALPYVDSKQDTALGEPCPTIGYLPPPRRLRGLIGIPGGFLGGFNGPSDGLRKEICFSAAYQCHAWPLANRFSVEHEVVGLVATQAGVVVATRGKPAIIIGSSPDRMEVVKLEVPYACTSAKSIVDMGEYAIYASPAGLVSIAGNTATLLTKDVLTREQWDQYDPQHLVGGTYNGKYFGFCPNLLSDENSPTWSAATTYALNDYVKSADGKSRYRSLQAGNLNHSLTDTAWWALSPIGFIFDVTTGDWTDISIAYNTSVTHLPTDDLRVVAYGDTTGATYAWNGGPGYQAFTWVSKLFALARPEVFGAGQVTADRFTGGVVTVEHWMDGVLRHTQRIGGDWSATISYAAGDVAHYSGKFYRSRVGSNLNHTPPSEYLDAYWVQCDPTEPYRMPSGFYANALQVVFRFAGGTTPVSIRRFALGSTIDEVRAS